MRSEQIAFLATVTAPQTAWLTQLLAVSQQTYEAGVDYLMADALVSAATATELPAATAVRNARRAGLDALLSDRPRYGNTTRYPA